MRGLDNARRVLRILRGAGFEAWLAGGCVRDHLLGLPPKDLDVATSATPDDIEALFRRTIPVGKAFGVIRVRLGGEEFEVATFRSDGEYRDGRRPEAVTFSDAVADVQRRDFTVNGLLWDPATDEIVDHVGGLEDLRARRIRAIGDPDARLGEDALRVLRAVRFACLHDFRLEPATERALARHADTLGNVSPERVREELAKIASHPASRRGDAWRLLVATGIAARILPEAPRDAVEETAGLLDRLERRGLVGFLAAVLRAARAPGTPAAAWRRFAQDVVERLRGSADERRHLGDLLGDRGCYRGLARRSLARRRLAATRPRAAMHEDLLRAEGDADDVLEALERCRSEHGSERPPPLLGGKDLLAAGMPRGPGIGRALRRLRLRQLAGEVATVDAARRYLGLAGP